MPLALALGEGTLTITVSATPAGDGTLFTFSPSWGASFQLSGGQSRTLALGAGTYSLTQTLPPGWKQTSAVVSNGNQTSLIIVNAGDNLTVTFGNLQCQQSAPSPPDPLWFARGIGPVTHERLHVRVDNGKIPGAWFELQAFALYAKVAQSSRRG